MEAAKRGAHPNSLANLQAPWKKGTSGNPTGTRKRPYTDRYHELAETPMPEGMRTKVARALASQFGSDAEQLLPAGSTFADAQAVRLHINALVKGDVAALREIADRCEGRAPNRLDLVGLERQEVRIRVVAEDPHLRADRATEFLYKQIINLVSTGNEQVATAAAQLAAVLKNKDRNVQPA